MDLTTCFSRLNEKKLNTYVFTKAKHKKNPSTITLDCVRINSQVDEEHKPLNNINKYLQLLVTK